MAINSELNRGMAQRILDFTISPVRSARVCPTAATIMWSVISMR